MYDGRAPKGERCNNVCMCPCMCVWVYVCMYVTHCICFVTLKMSGNCIFILPTFAD